MYQKDVVTENIGKLFKKYTFVSLYPWDTRPKFKMWEELPKSVFVLVVSNLSTSI